jgi:hypothetical protein
MPRTATVLEILIASPGDVGPERDTAERAIAGWNAANSRHSGIVLQPIRWELDSVPSMNEDGQAVINKQLVESADILIGVFWARLGTATPRDISGTAEEINLFRRSGKDVMIYFKEAAIPIDHDVEQLTKLKHYKSELKQSGLSSSFDTPSRLHEYVTRHLTKLLNGIVPTGRITSPADDDRVAHLVKVSGVIKYLPVDHRGWIVVETDQPRFYPMHRVSFASPAWTSTAYIGRRKSDLDKNVPFNIHLCSAGADADYRFQRIINRERGEPELYLNSWPLDTKVLDTKRVIRAD